MLQQNLTGRAIGAFAVLLAIATSSQMAVAQKDGDTPVGNPQIQAALADEQTREILLLMRPNENGKISEQEFMRFMKAEFKRFDRSQSGQVDAKELAQVKPQVVPSARYGK